MHTAFQKWFGGDDGAAWFFFAKGTSAFMKRDKMKLEGIISAAQKVEHYEMTSYGTLRQFAETLGLTEAASLLEETLNEEKAADEKLSEVATDTINVEAAHIQV